MTVRYTDDDGKEKVATDRLKLPPDVANGFLFSVLKNINTSVPKTTVSLVVAKAQTRLYNAALLDSKKLK